MNEKKEKKLNQKFLKIIKKAEQSGIDNIPHYFETNKNKLDKLIKKGADINSVINDYVTDCPKINLDRSDDGHTFFIRISNLNDINIAICLHLIDNFGAWVPPELCDYALYTQNLKLLEKLVKQVENPYWLTVDIGYAVKKNNYKMCEILLSQPGLSQRYSSKEDDLGTIKDQYFSNALCTAAEAGNYDMIKWLIEQGADPTISTKPSDHCRLPLHAMAYYLGGGHSGEKVTIDEKTKDSYLSCVKLLIDNGANPYSIIPCVGKDMLEMASLHNRQFYTSFRSDKSKIEKCFDECRDNPGVQICLEAQKYYDEKHKIKHSEPTSKTTIKSSPKVTIKEHEKI